MNLMVAMMGLEPKDKLEESEEKLKEKLYYIQKTDGCLEKELQQNFEMLKQVLTKLVGEDEGGGGQ